MTRSSSAATHTFSPRLTGLKWVAILAPIAFVGILEYVVWRLDLPLVTWPGRLVLAGAVVLVLVFLYGAIFSLIRRMVQRLERQNRELLALHHATRGIHGELALESLLQVMVEQAAELLDCRYGAISVIDEQGRVVGFHHTGIDEETAGRIGAPPSGHGLLGVVLERGERLRLTDIEQDDRKHGFPEHHPEMHSLLAVPIECRSPFRGNLYLSEKHSGQGFSAEDEETLVRFAGQAAVAIDVAHLHRRLRSLAVAEERARIGREMHDGMAQVLAYVNTKAQAVEEYLRRGKVEEAGRHLDELALAARDVYADVREGILALRAASNGSRPLARTLEDFAALWQEQTGIDVECSIDAGVEFSDQAELQLLRIVQEALTNVRKHAGAEHAWLAVNTDDGRVTVEVRDDGAGFNPERQGGGGEPRFGLAVMRERAESVDGELTVESRPGEGTTVRLVVPSR